MNIAQAVQQAMAAVKPVAVPFGQPYPAPAIAQLVTAATNSLSSNLQRKVADAVAVHAKAMIPPAVDKAKALMAKGATAEKAVEEAVKDIFRQTYTGKPHGIKKAFKKA